MQRLAAFQFGSQRRPMGRGEFGFEGAIQKITGDGFLPAGEIIAEISAAPGCFACGIINDISHRRANNAIQFPLGKSSPTNNAGALRNVFASSLFC